MLLLEGWMASGPSTIPDASRLLSNRRNNSRGDGSLVIDKNPIT